MELRLATFRNTVTAEQVRLYAIDHDISMQEAKQELENKVGPVLQYLKMYDPFGNGIWEDVPNVEIIR